MKTPDNDNLRSDKIRRILAERAPWILRYGTVLVIVAIALAAYVALRFTRLSEILS